MKRIRRGDVFLVSVRAAGDQVRTTRPALVIQNNVGNRHRELTIVAAIRARAIPVHVPLEAAVEPNVTNGLKVRSAIRLDHLWTIGTRNLVRRLGKMDAGTMRYVDQAIRISLGLAGI